MGVKNVVLKPHKGVAETTKEKKNKVDVGTGRVTRSSTRRSGNTKTSTEGLDITSPKTKSMLRNLEGSFANPEATAALEQEDLKETAQQEDTKTDDTDQQGDEHEESNLSLLIHTVKHLYGDLALL